MDANVYQHFRKEEHTFIDMVGDWIETVEDQYAPYLTEFLDPRQAYIVQTLVSEGTDLSLSFYGGYEAAERKRALIYPNYYVPKREEYDLVLYEIIYPIKFIELTHGKILGTLMSTGVKRSSFGDIISDGERWQVFITKEVANYVAAQVDHIGRVKVRLEERDYTDLIQPKDGWTEEKATTSSLRLDTVISTVYNISRQRSKDLINVGKVKVNWAVNEKPDFPLELLDIISVRGFGRIQIRQIDGKTKKGKIRLTMGVLRK